MAEVSGFSQFIEFMAGADAFTLLLPFLLSWMVYYIALEKADFIFGEDNGLDNLPPVIALFLAFFTARFIVLNPFYQTFFIDFFGKITIGVIGILGLLTMLAFAGYEGEVIEKGVFIVFILASVGAAFLYAGGFGPPWIEDVGAFTLLRGLVTWSLETGAIWGVVIIATIWLVIKEPSDDGGGNNNGLLDYIIANEALQDSDE